MQYKTKKIGSVINQKETYNTKNMTEAEEFKKKPKVCFQL